MSLIKPEWFLSKTCVQTFVHYAQGQIKKAQGLNKKIVNPVDKKLKNILDFCYVIEDGKTIQVNSWLDNRHWKQEYIGLAKLAHAQDLYAMYYDEISLFQGIMKKETANDVLLSSIPKKAKVQGYLSFNKEGYSAYRKQYHDYWLWVERRNNARYQQNIDHGRSYDSKNMMHTFRLLYVALGIAQENKVKVWCDNRDDLLAIKAGKFSYDELLERSERLIKDIKKAFQLSALPDEINHSIVKNTLINIRKELYK
ncbi:nucleotidyltransferase [Proteus vulgaris]